MLASALTTSTCIVLAISRIFLTTPPASRAPLLKKGGDKAPLLQRFRLLERFFDRPDHVEGLLGKRVALARNDHLEALDRVLQLDVLAFLAGEILRHAERLRQEALDFPRARHRELVLGGELVHAEDRDDVAQLLVALQRRLHRARGVVVVLA